MFGEKLMLTRRGLLGGLLACVPLFGMSVNEECLNNSQIVPTKIKLDKIRFKVNKRYSCEMRDPSLGVINEVQVKSGDTLIYKWITLDNEEGCTLGLIDCFAENGILYTRHYTMFNVNAKDFEMFYG